MHTLEIEEHFEQNRLYHYDQGDLEGPETSRPNILRGGRFRHRSGGETRVKEKMLQNFRGVVKETSSRGRHQTKPPPYPKNHMTSNKANDRKISPD